MKTDAFEQQASRLRAVALKASTTAGADADTAQDIAQETMIRLWQILEQRAPSSGLEWQSCDRIMKMRDNPRLSNPDGYAVMIARHLTLNHLRRKPPLPIDERLKAGPTAPSPLDLMVQREEEQWLRQRIRDLPPTQHAVLHLRQVEHRSNSQIATLLGVKETSVSTLLARARRQLLEKIRQQREREKR
jgi:RNA polymerase sigma-70 factor (ECF subfamily)